MKLYFITEDNLNKTWRAHYQASGTSGTLTTNRTNLYPLKSSHTLKHPKIIISLFFSCKLDELAVNKRKAFPPEFFIRAVFQKKHIT